MVKILRYSIRLEFVAVHKFSTVTTQVPWNITANRQSITIASLKTYKNSHDCPTADARMASSVMPPPQALFLYSEEPQTYLPFLLKEVPLPTNQVSCSLQCLFPFHYIFFHM